MAQAPVMPVWTDALIGDTTHLSTGQFGAYLLILIATWRNNGKALPDDDRRMARICRVSVATWRKHYRPILCEFFDTGDGSWHQKRLEHEWKFFQKQRDNGCKGGRPKCLKHKETTITQPETQTEPKPEPKPNPNVTPHTQEASLPKDSESVGNSESPGVARAREEPEKNQEGNPLAAYGRLGGRNNLRSPHEPVTGRQCQPSRAPPKSPALKAKILTQLRQKHGRFVAARRSPEVQAAYWATMLSDDAIAQQRMLDKTDREMRAEGWDDMREWKSKHLRTAA